MCNKFNFKSWAKKLEVHGCLQKCEACGELRSRLFKLSEDNDYLTCFYCFEFCGPYVNAYIIEDALHDLIIKSLTLLIERRSDLLASRDNV